MIDNLVLSKFLGICSFIGLSKNLKNAMGMSAAVIFVMFVATAVTYPIFYGLLEPNGLSYLPVSYTHLDVYKRQIQKVWCKTWS